MTGENVNIDGFNQIITLEVALSGSPVLLCMDGSYRDLAGLRGTYRLIDKTETAVRLIIYELKKLIVKKTVFWLDSPVSNSGRLKILIAQIAEEKNMEVDIRLTSDADKQLFKLPNVITGDSIILDRCQSWLNLNRIIIEKMSSAWVINMVGISR